MIWGGRDVCRTADVSLGVSQGEHVVMCFEVRVVVCPLSRKICNLTTGVMSVKFGMKVWNLGVKISAPLS